MSPAWLDQLDGLVEGLQALVGPGRYLAAVTVSAPPGIPLEPARQLLTGALARAGHPGVRVIVRPGTDFRVLTVRFTHRPRALAHSA